jgi:hypothetical protein
MPISLVIWEVENGGSRPAEWGGGTGREIVSKTPSQSTSQVVMVVHACHPNNMGSINRRITVQASLGKMLDPI